MRGSPWPAAFAMALILYAGWAMGIWHVGIILAGIILLIDHVARWGVRHPPRREAPRRPPPRQAPDVEVYDRHGQRIL